MSTLPILCYHNVGHGPDDSRFNLLYVTPAQFERQLWTIRRLGLRGVSLAEGLAGLDGHGKSRLVALTFDDGYTDTFTRALPLLKQYACTATCFLVGNAVGTSNYWDAEYLKEIKPIMTREQVHQWLAAGMEIGSHSCSHPHLEDLDDVAAAREIAESRATLQAEFGVPVNHFAYPFGGFSHATADLVRRAGYHSAVSLLPGIARATDDRYRLPRIFVNGERGWGKFLLQIATPYENLRHRR